MEGDKNESCYTINKGVVRREPPQSSSKSDYSSRSKAASHEDFAQAEEGALYSVSQRVPTVSTSYSSLCGATEGPAVQYAEWERTTSTDTKDTSSVASEKQTTGE